MTRGLATRQTPQGRFDLQKFLADFMHVCEARGLTSKAAGIECGIPSPTISRMKIHNYAPDIANFLAVCSWGGLDPMTYWRSNDG